jgi:hypothetical protein
VQFRYSGVVMVGLSPIEEDEVLCGILPRVVSAVAKFEEIFIAILVVVEILIGFSDLFFHLPK